MTLTDDIIEIIQIRLDRGDNLMVFDEDYCPYGPTGFVLNDDGIYVDEGGVGYDLIPGVYSCTIWDEDSLRAGL